MKKKEVWRAVKFTLFSASAGLIEMGSFTLNRRFTFKSASNVPVAMLKVAAYYAVFTPLSTWLGSFLADTLGWNDFLVTALNMVLNFVTEFLYQRFFVFGKSIDTAKVGAEKEAEREENA